MPQLSAVGISGLQAGEDVNKDTIAIALTTRVLGGCYMYLYLARLNYLLKQCL